MIAVALAVAVTTSVVVSAVYGGAGFLRTTTRNSVSYQLGSGYHVELNAGNSDVNVALSTNGSAYVIVLVKWSLAGQSPLVTLKSTHFLNTVYFTVTIPRTFNLRGIHSAVTTLYLPPNIVADTVNITVDNGNAAFFIPLTSTNLELHTTNGNIALNSSQSENIDATTGNGNIAIATSEQPNVTAATVNGNIIVQFFAITFSGTTQLTSKNGNINVQVNPSSHTAVSATTTTGIVSFGGPLEIIAQNGGTYRTFTGYVGNGTTGSASVHAVTANGNILISNVFPPQVTLVTYGLGKA